MRTIRIKLLGFLATVLLVFQISACSQWLPEPHHIEIQQGNVVKQTERDKLKLGMTKSDVQSLLGKAILRDPFHPDRWDYIYRIKSDTKPNIISRLTLYFDNKALITIDDSDFKPEN